MRRFNKCLLAAVVCSLGMAGAAHATVYTNTATQSGTLGTFGYPDTTSYGEYFTAPGGTLDSWTFWSDSASPGNLELVVATWNGSSAVGPALYTSAPIADAGNNHEALTFSGINLALTTAQSYIAYITVAGVSNPVSGATIETSTNDPLSGAGVFDNSSGADPLTAGNNTWTQRSGTYFTYSATFGPAAVPEPSSFLMLGTALAGLGFAFRRSRSSK